MNSIITPLRPPALDRRNGFTLIELLTVMVIILVLAGLILSVAGSAQYNAGKSRATAEIKAMETALESYKSDNGAYPESTDTDQLNAVSSFDPSAYKTASNFLWQSLSGITATGTVAGKTYLTFKPGQLNTTDGTPVTTVNQKNYVVDPFGFSYGYSTAYTKAVNDAAATPGSTPAAGKGYNPTFDLWSTAGYASGGRSLPSGMTATAASYNTLWIKNW